MKSGVDTSMPKRYPHLSQNLKGKQMHKGPSRSPLSMRSLAVELPSRDAQKGPAWLRQVCCAAFTPAVDCWIR